MTIYHISYNLVRGFSKSWHHVFVMSNICAFMLTWCLFVGNSRQTASAVPRHRASKYDCKLNLHLWNDSSSNGSSICACVGEGFVLHLVKVQSGFRRGCWYLDNLHWQTFFLGQSATAWFRRYAVCMACMMWNKLSSQVHCTFLRLQTASSTRWSKPSFVLMCSDFIFKSINQTRTMPNMFLFLFVFLLLYIWTHLANQHMVHRYLTCSQNLINIWS